MKLNRKIPIISHSMYKPLQIKAPKNCNAKNPALNRPSENKPPPPPPGACTWNLPSNTKQKW